MLSAAKEIRTILCYLLSKMMTSIMFKTSVILALHVGVIKGPGVSEVLVYEYLSITGNVLKSYQRICHFDSIEESGRRTKRR